MNYRNDNQLALVCCALLRPAHALRDLWTEHGPTDRAFDLLEADGGPLSSGERVLLLAAWAIWNGAGELKLSSVVHSLDGSHRARLFSLLLCDSSCDLDAWLERQEVARARD